MPSEQMRSGAVVAAGRGDRGEERGERHEQDRNGDQASLHGYTSLRATRTPTAFVVRFQGSDTWMPASARWSGCSKRSVTVMWNRTTAARAGPSPSRFVDCQ